MDAWVSSTKAGRDFQIGKNTTSSAVYGLSAILVHKGNMANSGHYVAHIKDECTGQWWQFDDEEVTNLGFHPLGDGLTGAPRKKDMHGNERASPSRGGLSVSNSKGQSASCLDMDVLTSADAYMLIYSIINESASMADPGSVNQVSSMSDAKHRIGYGIDTSMGKFSLPEQLQHEIDEMNETFTSLCEDFRQRKDVALQEIAARKQEIRQTLAEVRVEANDERCYWISIEWLRQWADSLLPP